MESSLIGGNQVSRHGYYSDAPSIRAGSESETLCPRSLELQGMAGVAEMARSLSKYPFSSPKTIATANHIYGRQESFLCPSPPPDHLDVDNSSTNSSLTDPPSSTPAAASYTCVPNSPPLDPGDIMIQNGSMAASFGTPSTHFASTPLLLASHTSSSTSCSSSNSSNSSISSSSSAHYCAPIMDTCRSSHHTQHSHHSHHQLLSSSTMDQQFHSPSPFSQSSMMDDGYASSDLPSDQQSSSGSQKNEEPYAQLIYKAFMSRPGHCMSLQDIYQWFRDNTKKATSEKGGWQNSIRHNLSMNAAFTKREKQPLDGCSPRSEAKRSTEWVLEAWAVADGVQSTTRYRKGTAARRCGSTQQSDDHLEYGRRSSRSILNASRAQSGRKGGRAASRLSRRGNQKYGEHLDLTPPTHPTLEQHRAAAPSSLHDYDHQAQMGGFHPGAGLPTNATASMTPRKYEDHHMRGGPDSIGFPATGGAGAAAAAAWDVYPPATAYYSHHQQQHHHHQAMPYPYHSGGRVDMQHVLYSDTGHHQAAPPFATEPLFSNMQDAMCDLSRTGV